MDLFFVQGFSFLGFLKNLGFVGYVSFCFFTVDIYVCVPIKRYHVVDHRKEDIGQNKKKSQKCQK